MSDDTLSIDQREAIGQAYVDRLQLLGERIIASVDEVVIGDPNDPVDRASFMASIAAAANDFTDRVHDRGAPDAGGRRMDAFFPRVSLGGDGRWRRPRGPFNPFSLAVQQAPSGGRCRGRRWCQERPLRQGWPARARRIWTTAPSPTRSYR
jgi:hypothetical protein